MKVRLACWIGLTLVTVGASAQVGFEPDAKETPAPPPPAFNQERGIPIEMPKYVSLRFGVDPATLVITPDGIVRYVMVATNANGAISAMYEGIRCATGEVKTYARYTASGSWTMVQTPQWRGLNDNLPSKHAVALASQGVCDGLSTTASSVADIVKALKSKNQGR